MEWEKAKNLILIFFILLNVVLAAFMLGERRRYTVTAEHEAVIRNVLAQHDITFDTEMIRRFPPMRALLMSGYYYDEDALLGMFFPESQLPQRSEYDWGISFTHGASELAIANGYVVYTNPHGMADTPAAFIRRHFPDFVLDEYDERFVHNDEDGEWMIFRQVYRGFTVYSNYIQFHVTDAGIEEVIMIFGHIHGRDGPQRPIFAPDEALITFLHVMHRFAPEQPVTIWHMDIVYFTEFDNAGTEYGSIHHAVPFYRIFTREFEIPFLINAYLNMSIDV
ncbi:MAG: hypothetical protein FWC71_05790 [Defluviitaleaceae bacterium]|nr:hypothetical protein [Defluviitaleaceae bacterium]